MRILFLSFPYASSRGGGERYTEQAVEGLKRAGHDTALVSSSEALLETFQKRCWHAHAMWCGIEPVTPLAVLLFPLFVIPFTPFFLLLIAWYRFAHRVKAIACLSLTDKLLATPFARLFGMRVIWTEHLVAGRSITMNPYRGWYLACAKLAQIVTVSEAAKRALEGVGVARERIRVISPGMPPAARAALIEAPIIGVISRLSKEKNVALALQAFAIVQKELPEAKLEIFGDGPGRPMLEQAAKDLGIAEAMTFHGYVENARGTGRFRVLTVPSSKESFGIVALEAMTDGLPVVATRVGGLPEVVEDGVTGLLVPPDDAAAMAEALLKLLRDPALAARLGEAGRARAARLFGEEKMQNAWIALFS